LGVEAWGIPEAEVIVVRAGNGFDDWMGEHVRGTIWDWDVIPPSGITTDVVPPAPPPSNSLVFANAPGPPGAVQAPKTPADTAPIATIDKGQRLDISIDLAVISAS
jgi:hypothetical protein